MSTSQRFCGKCSAAVRLAMVSCSGRCRRSFHSTCVGLGSAGYATWLDEPGLFWFCSDCQNRSRSFRPKEDHPSVGYSTVPPEMLVQIFDQLERSEIPKLRQVCRRWKYIVDNTFSLIGRMKVRMVEQTLDKKYEPRNVFTVATMGIRRCTIKTVNHWWPQLAQYLCILEIDDSTVLFPTFIGMLRQTPNLRWIYLKELRVQRLGRNRAVPHIELAKLQALDIEEIDPENRVMILNIFGRISYSQLKTVSIRSYLDEEFQHALPVIRAAQNTLEDINVVIRNNETILDELRQMPQLHLKRLQLSYRGEVSSECLINFFQTQSALQVLDLSTPGSVEKAVLSTIGQVCRDLKRLKIFHPRRDLPQPFLNNLTKLEYLDIWGSIDLTNQECHNLKEFSMIDGSCLGLSGFLIKSTKIQRINLYDCNIESWEDLFRGINHLSESLQYLNVDPRRIGTSLVWQTMTNTFPRLTELHLCFKGYFPKSILEHLFAACPRLEDVKIVSSVTIDDELMLRLLRNAEWLRKCTFIPEKLSPEVKRLCKDRNVRIGPGSFFLHSY